ncbi:MAG: Flp pilus assembly complex ATPase component TadA [Ignavibacteriae bacterium]|nr:Flp pilus assembly complex ATPase component TadA [Ignavibacteriota bacterium]
MIETAIRTLKEIAATIPQTSPGVERQMLIGDMTSKQSPAERSALKKLLDSYLMHMIKISASDIDLGGYGSSGHIWYRVYGDKKPDRKLGDFTPDEFSLLIQSVLVERQRLFLYENRNLDFSYTVYDGDKMYRYRADAYFDLDQLALNMRAINATVRPFKNLELHPGVARELSLTHSSQGLTLVTGITGSGKSSTLDSIIDANNHSVDAHIVIISSPVEYVHKPDRCIVRHREVGRDVLSFKEGAIQALRQDPDIIVIGEMRDPDTIMTALEITDSGHKVYSTLHTASAVETIDRVIGEVPPIEQERVRMRLADTLSCVISQKLAPTLDGKVVLAKEVMMMIPSVRAAIKNNNTGEIYQMMAESGDLGMITLEQDLKRLYLQKRISLETALFSSNNKRRFQQLMNLGD